MKKRVKYTNEPMDAKVIEDFLPPPEKLIRREENIEDEINRDKLCKTDEVVRGKTNKKRSNR